MGSGFKTFTAGAVLTASDVNNYLMEQSVMVFANSAARTSAVSSPEVGMVSYLTDTNVVEIYNGTTWTAIVSAGTPSYNFVSTLYLTSTTTFTKATYPWLRAIRVKCQGGGGGGGGVANPSAGNVAIANGGGGGAYAESFITNISGLAASVTVTVGAGGTAGAAGANNGGAGGTSSFGTAVSANGGALGTTQAAAVPPGNVTFTGLALGATTATGDITIVGEDSQFGHAPDTANLVTSVGGNSVLGRSRRGQSNRTGGGFSSAGFAGQGYGAGGNGAASGQNAGAVAGGAGAPGIVIIELYA